MLVCGLLKKKTETFEFHLAVLRFLATTDHTAVRKTMIQSILDIDIPISIIIQALPDKISTPLQSAVASLQQEDNSCTNPSITLPDIKNLQLKPTESGWANEQCGEKCEFCDIIRNRCNNRPTPKELAKFVIPYCSSQWRILGDLLEVLLTLLRISSLTLPMLKYAAGKCCTPGLGEVTVYLGKICWLL